MLYVVYIIHLLLKCQIDVQLPGQVCFIDAYSTFEDRILSPLFSAGILSLCAV